MFKMIRWYKFGDGGRDLSVSRIVGRRLSTDDSSLRIGAGPLNTIVDNSKLANAPHRRYE